MSETCITHEKRIKPKVALVFYGLLRSIQYTLPNLQKQVFCALTNAGYEYDIYCHNYTFPQNHKYSNARSREYNIDLDPNAYKLLNPKYYISDNQLDIAAELNLESYRTHGDPWAKTGFKTMDNYLLAMYSRKKVTELLAQNIASDPQNHEYTMVMFLRSDVLFEKELPIPKLLTLITEQGSKGPLTTRVCLIPNFHHWLGGLNDRMFISKPSLALEYGRAFDKLLDLSKERKLHSEQINKHLIIDVYHATPILVPIFFARVRANGVILKEDYNAAPNANGI